MTELSEVVTGYGEHIATSNGVPKEGTMPAAIAKAVCKVMAGVKRLERNEENKFQRYNYVSIDGFLEATGPLCAAAGLFIFSEELDKEITQAPKADREGVSNHLTIRWAFTLVHESGATYGPLHRTVTVPASGAQAYGSSQSYALKQFMRGLFQIPTGDDDDPDQNRKELLPASRGKGRGADPGPSNASDPATYATVTEYIGKADDSEKCNKVAVFIKTKMQEGRLSKKDAAQLSNLLLKHEATLYEVREPGDKPETLQTDEEAGRESPPSEAATEEQGTSEPVKKPAAKRTKKPEPAPEGSGGEPEKPAEQPLAPPTEIAGIPVNKPDDDTDPMRYTKALLGIASIDTNDKAEAIAEQIELRRTQKIFSDATAAHLQDLVVAMQKTLTEGGTAA